MPLSSGQPLAVIALGGNALLQRGERGSFDEQYRNVRRIMSQVADVIVNGQRLLITHGNGPQIGATLIRHELAGQTVPVFPLYACGAETQGFLGYMIQQSLESELAKRGDDTPVVTLVTEVVVDKSDPAFKNPTKPIGPFYTESQAHRLSMERKELVLKEDSGRGYRRLVPSPDPKSIQEVQAIRALVDKGVVAVACGGGGIPILQDNGNLVGVDAVIDKDLTAERLATSLKASTLAIMTDVDGVFLNYARDDQHFLSHVGSQDLARYAGEGHFASGSMGPKVEAVLRFLRNGGRRAVIGYLETLKDVLNGKAGTQITN